jgi:gamma-glutamyltranspeptidase
VCKGAAAEALEHESNDGKVVSAQHLASEVSVAILRQGGNAIDAAIAVGYAWAVIHRWGLSKIWCLIVRSVIWLQEERR